MFITIEKFPWIIKLFLIHQSLIRSNIIINYVIDEELPVLYCIGNILKDSKFNSSPIPIKLNSSRFILYAEDNIRHYFSLNNKTGDIFQSHRLDRETVCEPHLFSGSCSFKFLVLLPPKYWFRVTISVRDINDNVPVFRQSEITIHVKESEKKFYSLPLEPAIDNDLAQYSVQSYLLLGVEKAFSITYEIPMSLNLVVVDELDYDNESSRVFIANLIACDGGNSSKCGQQKLKILITDVNDNKPKFFKSDDSIKISEFQKINSVIYHANATDIDSNLFGKIAYKFSTEIKLSTMMFFQIDPISGEIILINSLESRKSAFLILKIIAHDEFGSGPFYDEMSLKIYIQSENNHHPKITLRQLPHKAVKEFSVMENSPPNTYIGLIMVEDPDKFENGQVECKLANNKHEFLVMHFSNRIKQKTFYTLNTILEIDCEKTNLIPVTVECNDFGRDSKTSSLTFNVRITDVNEYAPNFSKSNLSESVLENSPPGMLIMKLSAFDRDYYSNITFKLINNELFKINSETGEIFTFQHIDRETLGDFVNITVVINDNGLDRSLSSSSQILIRILDINDNIPVLVNKTQISFEENSTISPNFITTLKGFDPDLNENGTILYEIHSIMEYKNNFPSFNNQSFKIDPSTGAISFRPSFRFDYETADRYEFKLILRDNGVPKLSNKYSIIINILDINDNAPVWASPNNLDRFQLNITGQPDAERPIFRLHAYDYDSNKNNNLTYQIIINENDKKLIEDTYFLSPEHGYLYLKSQLSIGIYELKVQANDNGIPPLKSNILKLLINVHPNVTSKQTFSISITMMGVTIFLVSGLTLTILLGVGYLCKTKCHLHQSLMEYSKTSELKIKEFYPQNNDSDDIELKFATGNVFQPFYNEASVETNHLSHIKLDERFLNQNTSNPSGMVKSPVVCHELECSSTDSGHGASDENQYNSDRANQILKQLNPQMCCYTLLPSVSYNQCGCLQPAMISLGLESLTENSQSFNQLLTSLNPSTVCCSNCQEINIPSPNNIFHITHSDYSGS